MARIALLFAVCFTLGPRASMAAEPARPNFLIVLADDLGYGDLGCYGNADCKSPNLDRFASESLRLTHCYSGSAVCSPSRCALMTGRTPYRAGIHAHIPWDSPMHLQRSEVTIATLLRNSGYATCHSGKWHLNGKFNVPAQPQPWDHGFTHWFSTQNNALPNHHNPDNFVRNGQSVGQLTGYSSRLVVDEAIRWLDEPRPANQPFFLYVCFHEPHEPIATDPKYASQYEHEDPRYRAYYGNITQMDENFGRLLRHLDERGLRENTFVLFSSDNGPARTKQHPHGSTGGLREYKGHVYEGGIRVPGIVRWPGHTKPGSESAEPVCGVDLLPTVCQIVGLAPPADRAIDGVSLLPLFAGEPLKRTLPLYWQYDRSRGKPKVALRKGDWKILAATDRQWSARADIMPQDMDNLKHAKLVDFELYNLRADPTEQRNLATSEPERLRTLASELEKRYLDVISESPVWSPYETSPYESERIVYPKL